MHQNVSFKHYIFVDKMLVNCSICLGNINLLDKEVSILNCGHFFHANCLNGWLEQQMNCPECRAVVTRNNFVRNIFPKVNEESQLKSLEDKCSELQNELLRKEEQCDALKIKMFLLQIGNSSFKKSKFTI